MTERASRAPTERERRARVVYGWDLKDLSMAHGWPLFVSTWRGGLFRAAMSSATSRSDRPRKINLGNSGKLLELVTEVAGFLAVRGLAAP